MNTLKITHSDGSTHEMVPLKAWRQRCRCECKNGGPCEHDFSGPVVYTKNSGSVVCRHCGMTAMEHDMKLFEQITRRISRSAAIGWIRLLYFLIKN